ncbi:MAG: hypothetical protein ACI89X_002991 [Planctomycetota bacterium]
MESALRKRNRFTATWGGAVAGDQGERVQVTAWHNDGPRVSIGMMAVTFANGDGVFSFDKLPCHADGTFRIRAPAGKNRIYLRAGMGYYAPSEHVDVAENQAAEVVWRLVRKGC